MMNTTVENNNRQEIDALSREAHALLRGDFEGFVDIALLKYNELLRLREARELILQENERQFLNELAESWMNTHVGGIWLSEIQHALSQIPLWENTDTIAAFIATWFMASFNTAKQQRVESIQTKTRAAMEGIVDG